MHPASGPQLLALLGVLIVAWGQPGRAHHNLARLRSVLGHVFAVGSHHTHFDKWHDNSRLDRPVQLPILVPFLFHEWLEVGENEERACLG